MYLPLIQNRLSCFESFTSFSELDGLVNKMTNGRGASWDYCFSACSAMGADPRKAVDVAAANLCLLLSIHLVDDMLDKDPKGIYLSIGPGAAANMALAYQSIAFEIIVRSDLFEPVKLAVINSLSKMMSDTSLSQHHESHAAIPDEDAYWKNIKKKTPPLFSSALFTGALAGGADIGTGSIIASLGYYFGQMIQVSDDISDVFEKDVTADWRTADKNLALLFCMHAEYPQKHRFMQLIAQIEEPGILEQAQDIIIKSGALSYCLYHLFALNSEAIKCIKLLDVPHPDKLTKIADRLINPCKQWLKSMEMPDIGSMENLTLKGFA